MQISIENVSTLGRRLTVGLPAERLKNEIKDRTLQVTKTAKIPGFRPGKAPQIRQEALGKLIEDTLPEVLKEQALKPAGTPVVEKITEGTDANPGLQYIVSFEVLPEINLPEFNTFNIDRFEATITEADLDKGLKNLQMQLGILDNQPYDEPNSQNVVVDIGSNQFVPGFEEGIIGMKAGEEKVLNLSFPKDWRVEKMAGKPVQFTVTVKTVAERELAPLDENLAKKVGAEGTDEKAIRQLVRKSLEKESLYLTNEKCKKQIVENLAKTVQMEIPVALVKREIHLLHEDIHRKAGDKANTQCAHDGLEEEAKRRVALSLIFQKVVESEKIALDTDKVKAKVKEVSRSFNNAEFVENMYYESEEMIAGIRNAVLVEQALDRLLTKVTCSPKPISVDELFAYEG
jgi:trigger factor